MPSTGRITQVIGPMALRHYVNRSTGGAVDLALSCGRHGPILVNHTPMDCYPPAGWEVVGQPKRLTIALPDGSPPAGFWVANFDKNERALPVHLRVYWSWTGDGHWQVPTQPRLTFARHRILYKLYVTRQLSRPDEPLDGDPAEDLIRRLVPQLQKELFGGARQ